ncbi:MAG: 2,3-bisphosphoglycerate-independent phosphoglycerate mutase [Parcubacteria group bacterium]
MPRHSTPPPASPTGLAPIRPVVLLILDGWGLSPLPEGNPIAQAKRPVLHQIEQNYPGAALAASGISVGLVWGEYGNSEVGHRTLGSGTVLYQNLPRITLAIEDGAFFKKPALLKLAEHVRKNKSSLHIMGLLGNGGIHAHTDHLVAMIRLAAEQNLERCYLHLFSDGIDTPPRSSLIFLEEINEAIKKYRVGVIATIMGRDYAMDRDGVWTKTSKAYEAMVHGKGEHITDVRAAITEIHKKELGDERVPPLVVVGADGQPVGQIKSHDAAIFINFRNDRERQLTEAFVLPSFDKFDRGGRLADLYFVTMVQYEEALPVSVAFEPEHVRYPLARVLSEAGRKQLHVSETEKYAHVTFFFNGGIEKAFAGEERALVPSKIVKSCDERPEMSAAEITAKIKNSVESGRYDFIVANFANADMVGHTGNLKATVRAVEVLDTEIGEVMEAVLKANGALLITADHGNTEEMINAATGEIDKQHSTNSVPFYLVAKQFKLPQPKSDEALLAYYNPPAGVLADVAPTILELLGLPKHPDMTGVSLINIVQ